MSVVQLESGIWFNKQRLILTYFLFSYVFLLEGSMPAVILILIDAWQSLIVEDMVIPETTIQTKHHLCGATIQMPLLV